VRRPGGAEAAAVVLRDAGMIGPAAPPRITQYEQIFDEFTNNLRKERGLTSKSIIRHLPAVGRLPPEVCPVGDGCASAYTRTDLPSHVVIRPHVLNTLRSENSIDADLTLDNALTGDCLTEVAVVVKIAML
jgi:hypothetical protein